MRIEIKSVTKDYTSCNFCRKGEYINKRLILPYKEVFEINSNYSGGITISMCQECINELIIEVKKLITNTQSNEKIIQ